MATDASRRTSCVRIAWLLLAAGATIALWQLPYGNYAAYPFTILATWFHEMGHGLCALLLGGRFEMLVLFPDGSGVATHSGAVWLGRFGDALIAAAGPLGPALVGGFLLRRAVRTKHPRLLILMTSLCMIVSLALWVRSLFGIVSVAALAAALAGTAAYMRDGANRFAIQLLGIEACISAYRQFDYLFTRSVVIDGRTMLSDTGQMAQQLFLPYWFWGAALSAAIALLIIYGLLSNLEGVYAGLTTEEIRASGDPFGRP